MSSSTHGLAPEHKPHGNPCKRCGLPASRHRTRERTRIDYMRDYRNAAGGEPARAREKKKKGGPPAFIGIDGEGFTGKDGRHRYAYLAASTRDELISEIEDPNGIPTAAVIEWLLSLPRDATHVMFAAQYDWTLWFRDVMNGAIYDLWRPSNRELPPRKKGGYVAHRPIKPIIGSRVRLNLVATRLNIRSGIPREKGLEIWDLFKFASMSFVAALHEFGVGTKRERAAIDRMKKKRGKFRRIGPKEKRYCRHETRLLAGLAEKIKTDLQEMDLELEGLYGSGSIATAMLKKCSAQKERAKPKRRMAAAVERAFFAGRFELSACGPVLDAHANDVASAYPYAIARMPCVKHGTWSYVTGSHEKVLRAVRSSRAACVRYELPPHASIPTEKAILPIDPRKKIAESSDMDETLEALEQMARAGDVAGKVPKVPSPHTLRVSRRAWGPFPFRLKDGAILFPVTSAGGWIWSPELLAALEHPELWPNIRLRGAWVLRSRCTCKKPFLRTIAKFYARRLELGKDGRGVLLKKGLAACYGKFTQRVGVSPFKCPIIGGLITSTCRAMTLTGIACAKDPWDIVGVSSDALFSRVPLELPKPARTGTEKAAKRASRRDGKHRSPLGGWDHTRFPEGLFFIRPGQRFAIGTNDIKTTAARGLGIRVLHKAREEVLEAWKRAPRAPIKIERPEIFHGAKLTVSSSEKGYHRSSRFGQWEKPDPWKLSYEPLPKRPCFDGNSNRLLTWALGAEHGSSSPYDPAAADDDPDIQDLRDAEDEADAQPDGGIDTMGEDI